MLPHLNSAADEFVVGRRDRGVQQAARGQAEREHAAHPVRRGVGALAVGGGAAGIALALVATRPLRTLLYGISNIDPFTLASVLCGMATTLPMGTGARR